MKITLEGSNFTRCPLSFTEYDQFTIQIAGQDIHFQVMHANSKTNGGFGSGWEPTVVTWRIEGQQIQQLKVKTKEEIAAEESVAKAKEALKAAENALKAVKESVK